MIPARKTRKPLTDAQAAARKAREREASRLRMRKSRGLEAARRVLVEVEFAEDVLSDLVECKLLSPLDADNKEAIGKAIERVLIRATTEDEEVE